MEINKKRAQIDPLSQQKKTALHQTLEAKGNGNMEKNDGKRDESHEEVLMIINQDGLVKEICFCSTLYWI